MKIRHLIFKISVIVFLSSILLLYGFSYGNSLDSTISSIQQSYNVIKDLKAHFVQESMIKSWSAAQMQKAQGIVYFKKEGKMYWDYQQPTPQKIISDGKELWFYEPEDKQVTVSKVSTGLQSQISADLLNGRANLKRDFQVKLITSKAEKDKGRLVLELTPKAPQSNLNRVILRLDEKNFQIYQTEVYDLFDNLTRITFSQIEVNTNLPDSLFSFTPPSGVEILTPPTIPLPRKER
jgi:outer membrane lipoprotein carrier protein